MADNGTLFRRVGVMAIIAIAFLAVTFWLWKRHSTNNISYATIAVARGNVMPRVISSGTVNPVITIQVGTYVSGVIQDISCDFNTKVHSGQLCAKIDPRPYQTIVEQEAAALATAQAQLQKDQANLSYAKLIHERNAALFKRGIVSQETADTSLNAYEQSKAQLALDQATVAQHEAQLKAAHINLGYTNITSPVDGTVVARNVTKGQTVAASFQTPTLFLIATDLTKMEVDTNVSESDIGRVAEGKTASFTVTAFPDRQFTGTVVQVRQAPQTVQNVVTYDVVVSAPNPDLALKPGMTASMQIITDKADNVLRVPDQALRYRPSTQTERAAHPSSAAITQPAGKKVGTAKKGRPAHVWIVEDNRPKRVAIMIGLDDDSYAEVVSGDLHEGDAVIVSEHAGTASRPAAPTVVPMRR